MTSAQERKSHSIEIPHTRTTRTASGLTPLALNADPQSFDEAPATVVLDRIDRLAGFCAEVGAPLLILPCGSNQPRTPNDDDRINSLVEGLLAAADIGHRHGVRVVVEAPHFLRLIGDVTRTEAIMDLLDGKVPLVFDTSHIRAGGPQPAEIYPRWAAHTAHIQIRDAVPGDIRRALGYGDIDYTAFFAAAETAGYTGTYVLELETRDSPFTSKTDEVQDARTRLEEAFTAARSTAP